jgi:glycosyltransferase involved in cell wall biosynthesis
MNDSSSSKPSVLFLSPTPPPFAGTEVGGKYLLESPLVSLVDIHHVRSNIRTLNRDREKVNFEAVRSLVLILNKSLRVLITKRIDLVYFLITSNRTGLIRDVFYYVIAKAFGKTCVVHYKGSNYLNYYDRENEIFKIIIRLLLRGIGIIIVESKSIGTQFKGLIDSEKVRVLPPGINTRGLRVVERDFASRQLKLIYYGNLSVAKGLYDLSIAYERLLAHEYPVELHLAGEIILDETALQWLSGKHRNFYEGHFDEININTKNFILHSQSKGVFYHGILNTDKIYELCSQAHLLVFLSYSEGFSVSILESLALGLPMVLTRVGAVPDFFVEAENCLFVDPGDSAGAFEAIKFLFENRDVMAKMSRNNKTLAEKLFDSNKVGTDLAEIFMRVSDQQKI